MNKPLIAFVLLLLPLFYGCAGTTPASLRDAPLDSPTIAQVRAQPDTYTGVRARWGGTIIRTENLPQTTRIEVVARPLHAHGEPLEQDSSEGRFIAQLDQFLDPTIYSVGRVITVVGEVSGVEERELDQMLYRYPLLRVDTHHLWPQPVSEPYDPYWHAPYFYDPWYPFGYPYYPYRRYWPYHH